MVDNMDTLSYNGSMKSGIYQITNQVNGNCYIGSSADLDKRWRAHLNALCRGQHDNRHLQRAFIKYGKDAFTFSVLECAEVENLVEREQYYFDVLNPEYNMSPTAGSTLGFRHTPEARAKMSAACMGRRPTDETRAKLSAVRKGRIVSDETRMKTSAALMGHSISDITRTKISVALSGERNPNYGKHFSDETRAKMSEARKAWWRRFRASSE